MKNKYQGLLNYIIEDSDIIPKKFPEAMLICGQPGAGKSAIIKRENTKNFVFINGDEYRYLYNDVSNLKQENVYKYLEESGKVSGNITEKLIQDLSDKKYNLIIEGTMRTSEVPIQTATYLKEKGYTVKLSVVATKPLISKLSAINRYLNLLEKSAFFKDVVVRPVDPIKHDVIANNIANHLRIIEEKNIFDEISISTRDREIYTKSKSQELIHKVYKEIVKGYSQLEKESIQNEIRFIKNKLDYVYELPYINPPLPKEEVKKTLKSIERELQAREMSGR